MTVVAVLAGILALAFLLAACQPSVTKNAGSNTPESEAATEVSASTQETAAAETVQASYPSAMEAYKAAKPHPGGTCVECHTDQAKLETSKSADTTDASLYLVDADFPNSTHGALGCTYCHGGHSDTEDATLAMKDMNAYPTSDGGLKVCGTCHGEIADTYQTSLHYTSAGLENAWDARLAQADESAGAQLSEQYYHNDEGYQGACVDCHADCGECHVRNADAAMFGMAFNGFIDGHNFSDQTSNDDINGTCLNCHAGAIAACFTEQDVHGINGENMNCMDCHKETDIHGDGEQRETMIHSGAIETECGECHEESSLTGEWHSAVHQEGVECWACHTESYRTCYSCHGWNAAERGDVSWTEKNEAILGYDPDNSKVTTLVKAPIDEGMLGDAVNYQLDDADLANRSTWWPGFTHGIVKPVVSQEFCDRCHGEGTALLKEPDLQYEEYEKEHLVTGLPDVKVEDYQ